MVEEWVIRDSLAIALQQGQDPDEVARTKAFAGYTGSFSQPAPAEVIALGDSGPRPDDHRAEVEMVLELIQRVWNDRDLEKVDDFFVRDLVLQTVGNDTIIRPEGYRRRLLKTIRPFPAGQFEVRDVATNADPRYAGLRIAVVWKFSGHYNGTADFGPLTGSPVDVLGISQFLVQNGRIVREVRLYDEIALRAQIAARRGDVPYAGTNIY
jgi:predicted ester cyclase